MNPPTSWEDILIHVFWALLVLLLTCKFREPLTRVLLALAHFLRRARKVKVTKEGVDIEAPPGEVVDSDAFAEVKVPRELGLPSDVEELIYRLLPSCHSFEWLRKNAGFGYTDEQFRTIIVQNASLFEPVMVRQEKGRKPPLAGVRLTESARKKLQ
ncbi:MAG: hypothetical protein HQ559_12630 [Lentisphaerae bacterium]|nr:hypothetical protein [Lentisphaerota bacterium]